MSRVRKIINAVQEGTIEPDIEHKKTTTDKPKPASVVSILTDTARGMKNRDNGTDCLLLDISDTRKSSIRSNFDLGLDEQILWVRDTSFWGNKNQGLVITDKQIVYIPDNDSPDSKYYIEFNDINSPELENHIGDTLAEKLRADIELIEGVYPEFDVDTYLKGDIAPVFFGSALNNFGVKELLDCFIKIAPSPRPIQAVERVVEPEEDSFTGFIFKIHANMDPNHRSCIAFVKICSGRFERNAPYKHVRFGKQLRFSSPTAFMAQKKETVDEAFAGDIIGLPDTGNFKIGDTLTSGEELHFKGLPSFSPEMFKYIENADPMKAKQLNKGIEQLMDEGVAQLFTNQFNGRKIIGTVGQLQFEVIQYRLLHEYGAQCKWEPISLYKACWIESDNPVALENFKKRKSQYMALDKEGRDVYLADSGYVLTMAQQDFPDIRFHFTSEF